MKSSRYLQFITDRRSSVTGRVGKIDAHHEHLFPGFGRGKKKKNDFQALPLEHEEHIEGRHTQGLNWWNEQGLDPRAEAFKLLREYSDYLRPIWFDDPQEFEDEITAAEHYAALLEEMILEDPDFNL